MPKLNWLTIWDLLHDKIASDGKTSYGKNELLALMEKIEHAAIRQVEKEEG